MHQNLLYIDQVNKPNWKEASEENYADRSTVAVWRAPVPSLIPHINHLRALLRPEETEKINRYKQEPDRNQRVISKAVLRILLNRYTGIEPKEIRFRVDKNKKPCLENNFSKAIQFSVSHSGDWILIALTNNSVGIDLEQMNASFTYQNMLNFSFDALEINYIEQVKLPYQSFYQLWTRKESLLKATGKGLVDDLAQIPSLDGVHPSPAAIIKSTQSWQISSFEVDEKHVASVAFDPVKTVLQFFNFQL